MNSLEDFTEEREGRLGGRTGREGTTISGWH